MQSQYVGHYETLEKNHWWWQVRRKIIWSLLQQHLPEAETRPRLLDIGCGPGITLQLLSSRYTCFGVEPEEQLREVARRNAQVPILPGRLPDQLPKIAQLDAVLLLDVLEHTPDDQQSMRAISQLLRHGGLVLLTVPAFMFMWSVHDEANQHYRRYTAGQLRQLLEAAGFTLVTLHYWGATLLPLAYLVRTLFTPRDPSHYRLRLPYPPLNTACRLLAQGDFYVTKKLSVPFGLSLIAVAQKG